jgi:hypothetical protein
LSDIPIKLQIVPKAAEYLFRAVKSWSNLQALSLTNINFPNSLAHTVLSSTFVFQAHRHLYKVHIGQATGLAPTEVVALVMNVPSLRQFTLEDVYEVSIWGSRVRDADIVGVVKHLQDEDPRKQRVKEVVKCTWKLGRIIGGDRGS